MTVCNLCIECNSDEKEVMPPFNWDMRQPKEHQHVGFLTTIDQYSMVDACLCKECYKKLIKKSNFKMEESKAAQAHAIWSHWMRYFMKFITIGKLKPEHVTKNGVDYVAFVVPREKYNQWCYQMNTEYKALSEEEKESDREVARKYLL